MSPYKNDEGLKMEECGVEEAGGSRDAKKREFAEKEAGEKLHSYFIMSTHTSPLPGVFPWGPRIGEMHLRFKLFSLPVPIGQNEKAQMLLASGLHVLPMYEAGQADWPPPP